MGQNLIFLISQPRSGSTLIQRILGNHPDIHTTSEPWIMLHPIYALRHSGIETEYSAELSLLANTDFISHLPGGMAEYNESLANFYGHIYQRIIEKAGKSYYLDKTPRYYFIIEELHDLYPEAKIILLFRNPLAVLASIIKTWSKRDWYRLSDFRSDLIDAIDYLLNGLALLESSGIFLSFERFLANPEKSLKSVTNNLGVNYMPEIINYENKSHAKWEFGDQDTVKEKCRPDSIHADQWQDNLNDPQTWRVLKEYFEFIGKDRFEKMGYSFENNKRLLDIHKPSVDIEKHSIGLWELLDNTCSYLIENRQLSIKVGQLTQQIQANDRINIEILNEYIKLKWKHIAKGLLSHKVAVYGTKEYCIWLHRLTKQLVCLDPIAVIIDHDSSGINLWNKVSLNPEELKTTDVSAIILATECFQKRYAVQCRELYGEEIKLIDLYKNISSGPYKKYR